MVKDAVETLFNESSCEQINVAAKQDGAAGRRMVVTRPVFKGDHHPAPEYHARCLKGHSWRPLKL
jgi:hypothetical protein